MCRFSTFRNLMTGVVSLLLATACGRQVSPIPTSTSAAQVASSPATAPTASALPVTPTPALPEPTSTPALPDCGIRISQDPPSWSYPTPALPAAAFPSWALPTPERPPVAATEPEDLLGLILRHPSDIYGVTTLVGPNRLRPRGAQPLRDSGYELALVRHVTRHVFWLLRPICSSRYTLWQIIDMLVISPLPRTQVIQYSPVGECTVDGEPDEEVIAVFQALTPVPPPWSNILPLGGAGEAIRGWRASSEVGRIVEIAPDGIECFISGEGYSFPWDQP